MFNDSFGEQLTRLNRARQRDFSTTANNWRRIQEARRTRCNER